jgi:2Fe-2S ferredoxin
MLLATRRSVERSILTPKKPQMDYKKNKFEDIITISIPQLNKIITVPTGRNLFRVLRENKIPIAQSCLGDGICATCYLQITPKKNCTSPSKREQVLKEANKLPSHLRISCLLRVLGDVSISTTYW